MSADTPAPPSGPSQILAAVRRRWWLILLFAAVGAAVGFLLYATRQPTYRADAKLRVLKKDSARDATAGRAGYVDDYVNSQQETIVSDYILGVAATSDLMKQASPEFQARLQGGKEAAADFLRSGLVVTRGKDTSAGLANSVLLLSFTADNSRDSKIALEAVIKTFTDDLKSKSDQSVQDAISKVRTEMDGLNGELDLRQDDKLKYSTERFKITTEDPQSISLRWASGREELAALDRQLAEVNGNLELLKSAKGDRRDRVRLVELITGTRAPAGDASAATLEGQKRLVDQNIKRLGESLGKDHPTMKEEVAKRDYLAAELARLNPDNPTGETDDLALLQAQLTRKKVSLDAQRAEVEGRVDKCRKELEEIRPLQVKIDTVDFAIARLREQVSIKATELTRLSASQKASDEAGGIEATTLNPPREGGRVGPVLVTWLAPGALLAGLLAAGLSALLELRDQRFRTPAEVRQRLGLPLVGHLPALRLNKPAEADAPAGFDPSLVAAVRPKSAEAEAFRGLRTQVFKSTQATENREALKVIQVTSPCPSDGKSTLAANLAVSIAQAGKSVVIIDADFRKPRVHHLFGLKSDVPGLAAAAEGEADVFAVVKPTAVEQLSVIPCGPRPDAPAELLSSPRFAEVLRALKGRFDYVIVDTPPILAVSDPRVVAQRADAVLLTLRLTNTSRNDGERAAEMLTDLGVNVLGVAVNATRPDEGYGYGGYKYQYGADGYTA
jgi:capsular exopolysaccharide synthesis family protein